ncbi:MAG: hypothetical protein ACK5Y6_01700 [Pseudomonadota bacterium]|jgi:hypothetical protein
MPDISNAQKFVNPSDTANSGASGSSAFSPSQNAITIAPKAATGLCAHTNLNAEKIQSPFIQNDPLPDTRLDITGIAIGISSVIGKSLASGILIAVLIGGAQLSLAPSKAAGGMSLIGQAERLFTTLKANWLLNSGVTDNVLVGVSTAEEATRAARALVTTPREQMLSNLAQGSSPSWFMPALFLGSFFSGLIFAACQWGGPKRTKK